MENEGKRNSCEQSVFVYPELIAHKDDTLLEFGSHDLSPLCIEIDGSR